MTIEDIKQFFESSTIHGLYYISTARRWSRLFWMLIVLVGFSGAGYLIHVSFRNWNLSPVTTTVETLPISQITFPNVTICPPKTLFLNLNYDILQSEKIKLDNEKREKLIKDSITIYMILKGKLLIYQFHYICELSKNTFMICYVSLIKETRKRRKSKRF